MNFHFGIRISKHRLNRSVNCASYNSLKKKYQFYFNIRCFYPARSRGPSPCTRVQRWWPRCAPTSSPSRPGAGNSRTTIPSFSSPRSMDTELRRWALLLWKKSTLISILNVPRSLPNFNTVNIYYENRTRLLDILNKTIKGKQKQCMNKRLKENIFNLLPRTTTCIRSPCPIPASVYKICKVIWLTQ